MRCLPAPTRAGLQRKTETDARMGNGTSELTGLDHAYIARESLPLKLSR
ncbi:MAG: hypothetical protein K0S45_2686 [Nitrospira sp.]|jgi:hypothetical protein|nr:hypothetical protein [Nitrospira sp.]